MTELPTRFRKSLEASWYGYERLWVVFWVYYVPVAIVTGYRPGDPPNEWYIWVPVTVIYLVWFVWITVSLWRCAYGTDYRFLGSLVRLFVFFEVSVTLIYLVIYSGILPS